MKVYAKANAIFKASKIISAAEHAEVRVLQKQGYVVREVALGMLKPSGKKNVSSKPGDPPKGHLGLLKKHLKYDVNKSKKFVDIGPEKISKPGLAPAVLEHGGIAVVKITRHVGSKRVHTGKTRRVVIKARPFMGPSLRKSLPVLSAFWANSIKR